MVARERRNNPLDALTGRERDVLGLLAEGRSHQAIADRLVVNLRTAEVHVSSLSPRSASASAPTTTVACAPCCSISPTPHRRPEA